MQRHTGRVTAIIMRQIRKPHQLIQIPRHPWRPLRMLDSGSHTFPLSTRGDTASLRAIFVDDFTAYPSTGKSACITDVYVQVSQIQWCARVFLANTPFVTLPMSAEDTRAMLKPTPRVDRGRDPSARVPDQSSGAGVAAVGSQPRRLLSPP
jgi:hypothetical protein